MAKANGGSPTLQAELELDEAAQAAGEGAQPGTDAPAQEETAPAEPPVRVARLVNDQEGCWKVLETGEKVALSDEEWRAELAHHFRREGAGDA